MSHLVGFELTDGPQRLGEPRFPEPFKLEILARVLAILNTPYTVYGPEVSCLSYAK